MKERQAAVLPYAQESFDRLANGKMVVAFPVLTEGVDYGFERKNSRSVDIYRLLPRASERGSWSYWPRDLQFESRKDLEELDGVAGDEAKRKRAVALLKSKRPGEAFELLADLEKRLPEDHDVAVYLSLAKEMLGENEQAMVWAIKAIERHPEERGSGWLHLKILEARMEMEADPNWLRTHSVAGLDFGPGSLPALPVVAPLPMGSAQGPFSVDEIYDALGEKLALRLQFFDGHDPVMADLLLDYGMAAFFVEGARWSTSLVKSSGDLGVQRKGVREIERSLQDWANDHPPQRFQKHTLLAFLVLGVCVGMTVAWVRCNQVLRMRKAWDTPVSILWVFLAVLHLLVVYVAWMFAVASWFLFEWMPTVALFATGVLVSMVGHFHGLSLLRGKAVWVGTPLLPFGFWAALVFWWNFDWLALLACMQVACRCWQGCSGPIWLQENSSSAEEEESSSPTA